MNIRENNIYISILTFVFIYGIIYALQPSCFFMKSGELREFGIGYTNKTIFPLWLCSIILGIMCYLGISYFTREYY